jgi:hypothetical protein
VYPGLDPRVIDELPNDRVETDLLCWIEEQAFLNRKPR